LTVNIINDGEIKNESISMSWSHAP